MTSEVLIGNYRILEPLGQGGMGVVYRARHLESERPVALKTVKVNAPSFLQGLRREIGALTRIRHPGVVRIVDHGVEQGLPWYAMDLLEGESLRRFGQRIWSPYRRPSPPVGSTEDVSATDRVPGTVASATGAAERVAHAPSRDGALPPAAAGELSAVLRLMRRICSTLAFLHGEGFVNCDLKPENVLLVGDQPVIIDFGLTAHHPGGTGREALETQRAMAGTLPYMAPEQIRGDLVDARSDLYALGCMLHELVTGGPPFSGDPRGVMMKHLSSAPTPASHLVDGVPEELELVLLKLLEKDMADRFGFADEVASVLARLSADSPRLTGFPPPRPYLYRPRFVGREDAMALLGALRDRLAAGSGSFALVGGESGIGKTRLAMELSRVLPGASVRVVTSESSALSLESPAAAVTASPLQAVRPLLQAIADRCQEGGPDVTDRLLGERRSVLAIYEPLLAQVPARQPMAPAMPLASSDGARQRLFAYLRETIATFANEQPVMWVVDDLGWADDLSVDFLRSMSAEFFETTPLFVLGTYRSEEATDAVASMANLSHVTRLALPRLDERAVSSMIGDMLALREARDGFVSFVASQAEGNPFFVAEHVRTAVAERVLYRDHGYSWQVLRAANDEPVRLEDLPLPHSLRDHLELRLGKLTPAAQQVGLAAAVIGREAGVDDLPEVADLAEDVVAGALDELLRRQILEQPEPGRVRFAHDKLREVAYARAAPERAAEMHGRTARALEVRFRDRADANEIWATVGRHFAAGHDPARAAKYLARAAERARAVYANGEAIRLFREAIQQTDEARARGAAGAAQAGRPAPEPPAADPGAELHEGLADVLALTGKWEEARAVGDEALRRTRAEDAVARARIHRKIGKTWETQHRHEEALRLYALAAEALGADAVVASRERCDEWIRLQIDRLWVHYWLAQVPEMNAILGALRPVVEESGSPSQRAQLFIGLSQLGLRRDRYIVDEETLAFARAARRACDDPSAAAELPMVQFCYGVVALLHGSLEEADVELRGALELARRAGDAAQRARCLTYLTLTARKRRRDDEVRALAAQSLEVSTSAGMRDYVAAAQANQAWLALRSRELDRAAALARSALDTWRSLSLVFPLQWTALLPLLSIALERADVAEAVSCATALLDPHQQPLPPPVAAALSRAQTLWGAGDAPAANRELQAALEALGPELR